MYKHSSLGNGFICADDPVRVSDDTNAAVSNLGNGTIAPYIETENLSPLNEQVIAQHWKLSSSYSVGTDESVCSLARLETPEDHTGVEDMPILVEVIGCAWTRSAFIIVPILVQPSVMFTVNAGNWYSQKTGLWVNILPHMVNQYGTHVNSTVVVRYNLTTPLLVGWAICNRGGAATDLYVASLMMSARIGSSRINTFEKAF